MIGTQEVLAPVPVPIERLERAGARPGAPEQVVPVGLERGEPLAIGNDRDLDRRQAQAHAVAAWRPARRLRGMRPERRIARRYGRKGGGSIQARAFTLHGSLG